MSKLAVANIIFETTESNRIEYTGNNVVRVRANGGMQIPFGTTAQRASPEVGLIRYNTDTNTLETYETAGWLTMPTGQFISAVFGTTNVAFNTANAAFASANNVAPQVTPAFLTGNLAYALANNAYASINSNWTVTNTVYGVANAAYGAANNVGPQIAPAFNQANTAFASSNSANSYAENTFVKLTAPNQTVTGNLAVTGTLTILGNTTSISSNNLIVGDSMIYLAANNYSGTDILDIGFVANYANGTGANVHTGLLRDATNKQYYLFQGLDIELFANNTAFTPGANGVVNAVLNADLITSNLTLGGANTINWIGAAYASINSNWTVTNTIYGVANAAFAKANNALPLAGGTLTGKPTISIDDASRAIAGSHLTINSPTLSQASLGFAFGGVGKASLRIDSGGSFVMNSMANTYYYGYDVVNGGATTSYFYNSGTQFMYVSGANVNFPTDVRSPIFYDKDNTGYYYDGASTTNINGLNTGGTTCLFGSSGVRNLNFGANEIAWYSATTAMWLNICDSTGSNGQNYSLYIRGLATNGTASATLSSINLWATTTACSGNLTASGYIYAPGTVVQVQQTAKTSTTSIAVNGNSWNEFDSAFRVTITPKSSSSKILISAYITGAQNTGTVRYKFQYSTNSGSTWNDVTPIGDAVSNRSRGHFGYAVNGDTNQFNTCSMELLHSPATTSAIIYRIQFGQDVTTTYHFNRSIAYSDNFLGGTMASTIIAKEIAA